jgi:hypothetical protein
MMAAGTPCDGMDPQQPVLRRQHVVEPGKTRGGQAADGLAACHRQVLELPGQELVRPPAALAGAATSDPLFLSTLRLRV